MDSHQNLMVNKDLEKEIVMDIIKNSDALEKVSLAQLKSTVGGHHSGYYRNGYGTGKNIKAISTVAELVGAGLGIVGALA